MTSIAPQQSATRVLVIDDEPSMREMIAILLKREGYEVSTASGFARAKETLASSNSPFALVITDMVMPDGNGLDLLSLAKQRESATEVIVMTAHSSVDTAIEAMRRGAYDFVAKPFQTAELKLLVSRALEKSAIVAENARLRARLAEQDPCDLGDSPAMREVRDLVERVASSRTTVLITGDSGVGKERVARAIHARSDRAKKPFLAVNCGALPESLMESELFGHEKGAFTGANIRHSGLFQEADGGTLLLDEIGELPVSLQVKLLRSLQERKVRPVGATSELSVDVRVIAATNLDIEKEVAEGRFRQDLYYRLAVIRIHVAPLSARPEDVPRLIEHFLGRFSAEQGRQVRSLSPDAMRAILSYGFPGNVRELENAIERAVTLCQGPVIGLGDLPASMAGRAAAAGTELLSLPADGCQLDDVIAECERRLILQALERTSGSRTQAAKLLGLTLRSFRYRLAKLGMSNDDDDPERGESSQRPNP